MTGAHTGARGRPGEAPGHRSAGLDTRVIPDRDARVIPTLDSLVIPNLEGLVQTVLGPVSPQALGTTLMHEHLFLDIRRPAHSRNPRPGEWEPQARDPLTLANLAAVRGGRPNADNDVLGDLAEMLDEIGDFARQGGGAMVEVTSAGIGRDPRALARLSRASGLHLVMGAGWYQRDLHPADFPDRTLEDLTAEIVRDLVVGVDGTGIRSGIIGEVGAEGDPVDPQEMRSVRAAGRAAAITGAPITLHMGGFGEAKLRVLDALEEEGADPRSVIFGHAGSIADDMHLARRLLARGASVEADFLGTTGSPWGTLFPFTDRTAARGFAELVADGWGAQLVLGGDVCQRVQLRRCGGHGYGYVVEHFLPTLAEFGVGPADLDRIMVENPARLLAFRAPRAA
ncbi:phosphotriesterase family protein [Leucobacter triazinivorans]|uniref:phosphotriesterase family protein n=1 Tax=Leucobacter triazinivorans TaxID=1784719 RepID=UPI001F0FB44A|nr:aryldialkylphosphatase [Leucobacter triazinivorans]